MTAIIVLAVIGVVLTLQRRVVCIASFGTPISRLYPKDSWGTYREYQYQLGPVGFMIGWRLAA